MIRLIDVLKVFENGIERIHPMSSEKSDAINHGSNASNSEGTSTEANQDNIVSRRVICREKAVNFTNVLHIC